MQVIIEYDPMDNSDAGRIDRLRAINAAFETLGDVVPAMHAQRHADIDALMAEEYTLIDIATQTGIKPTRLYEIRKERSRREAANSDG